MPDYILDTDHLTLFDHGHPIVLQHYHAHPLGSVGLTAVTVEEYLRGRLASLAQQQTGTQKVQAYARLLTALDLFRQFPIVPFDQAADVQYQQLRRLRVRVGSRDLRIGATALTQQLIVVTRNKRDFKAIPGLTIVDWSV
jgi:tRNA(fMet)-specific endonuclease VapC